MNSHPKFSLQQSKQALKRSVSPCSHPAAPYPKIHEISNTNHSAQETTSQTHQISIRNHIHLSLGTSSARIISQFAGKKRCLYSQVPTNYPGTRLLKWVHVTQQHESKWSTLTFVSTSKWVLICILHVWHTNTFMTHIKYPRAMVVF